MTRAPRVFLVDDDPFQLQLLGGLLRAAGHTLETFAQPEALLARLLPCDRGCVVMDLRMPGLDGLALQRSLNERGSVLPVVFVSGRAAVPDAVAALKQGAVDFLEKPVDPAALLDTVARALHRDAAAAALRATRDAARERWATLTERERQVCRLSAEGQLLKQVAATLGLTTSTVHTHRSRALQKLGIDSLAELVHWLERLDTA